MLANWRPKNAGYAASVTPGASAQQFVRIDHSSVHRGPPTVARDQTHQRHCDSKPTDRLEIPPSGATTAHNPAHCRRARDWRIQRGDGQCRSRRHVHRSRSGPRLRGSGRDCRAAPGDAGAVAPSRRRSLAQRIRLRGTISSTGCSRDPRSGYARYFRRWVDAAPRCGSCAHLGGPEPGPQARRASSDSCFAWSNTRAIFGINITESDLGR
jgi:hypothetical protein